ncbi:hypothetical protein [Chitinophaga arvensicola]|uniref:Uncharacterized protein n=1 Tax=Chitinophaga arvensicola TaxID=29529 RepID=A0A1I0S730_9BACT|nr:hypothetical protein [Chitinophaga arvensicola]SEW51439.1 hypothetical protein SAMN04488122_4240 [Chitinophaga arvensicola]
MSVAIQILFRSFIKAFYRENAGAFGLLFTMLFLVVAPTHGAGVVEYHYSLIIGFLKGSYFLLLVFTVWLLYAWKCVSFVTHIIQQPACNFLHILNYLSKTKRFFLFLLVEISLLLPVLVYATLIVIVGCQRHFYLHTGLTIVYLLVLSISAACWHVYLLTDADKRKQRGMPKQLWLSRLLNHYPVVLLRVVIKTQWLKWLGLKIITCGLLYGIARNNTTTAYDAATIFWIFNFCILAGSILIFRMREYEERYLSFYRGAPVALWKRFSAYATLYACLMLPEFYTLLVLTPVHLHITDAINFGLCGFSLILLMNSITFLHPFRMKTYLKIALGIGCIQFIFLLFLSLLLLYPLFFLLAAVIFRRGYYRYE